MYPKYRFVPFISLLNTDQCFHISMGYVQVFQHGIQNSLSPSPSYDLSNFNHHHFIFLFFLNYLFIYLFMAVLGPRLRARALSSCGKRGPLLIFIAVRGPLTVAASLVAEHRLQTRRLSNCGSRA